MRSKANNSQLTDGTLIILPVHNFTMVVYIQYNFHEIPSIVNYKGVKRVRRGHMHKEVPYYLQQQQWNAYKLPLQRAYLINIAKFFLENKNKSKTNNNNVYFMLILNHHNVQHVIFFHVIVEENRNFGG